MTTELVKVSDQEISDTWRGRTKKEIIYKFGPPTRETSDGEDGTILVYEYDLGSNTTTKTSYNQHNNTKQEQSSTSYVNEYAWFYMDSDDICVGVKHNHFKKQERVYNEGATMVLVLISIGIGVPLVMALIMTYLEE